MHIVNVGQYIKEDYISPRMRLPYLLNIWMADDFVKTLKYRSHQNIEVT